MSWDPKEPEKEWTGTLRFNATEGNVDHRNEFTPHTTRRRRLPKRSSVATKPAIETKPPCRCYRSRRNIQSARRNLGHEKIQEHARAHNASAVVLFQIEQV